MSDVIVIFLSLMSACVVFLKLLFLVPCSLSCIQPQTYWYTVRLIKMCNVTFAINSVESVVDLISDEFFAH